MSNQLIKITEQGKENVFPRTRIQDLFDDTSGQKLIDILNSFNMMFVPYLGNKSYTRNQISPELRRQGLWLTYVIDNTVYTEWYDEVAIDDTNWGNDSNWRQGSNALVGDLSISPNGTWVINGEDSGITIKGDKGDSPVIRIYDNKIQVSYDKGVTYEDLNNTPVYTKFRFNSQTNTYQVSYDLGGTWQDISDEKVYHKFRYNQTTNTYQESIDFGKTWSNISAEKVYYQFRYNAETNTHQVSTDLGQNWTDISSNKVYYQFRTNDNRLQVSTDLGTTWENCSEPIAAWFRWADTSGTGNVGKVQISRDNKTWSDLSPTITNNLYIKGYVSTVGDLPTSSAAIGDIYMVGPTYDESDATHNYPHYRMWVKQSSGWVDNGEFTNAGPVSTANIIDEAVTINKLSTDIQAGIIYDVSAHNNSVVFESLSALLSSPNLSTLIPTSVRHGGMCIRFIQGSEQSSDNKYVQFRLMLSEFTNAQFTSATNWQGIDDEPDFLLHSNNIVSSKALYEELKSIKKIWNCQNVPNYKIGSSDILTYGGDGSVIIIPLNGDEDIMISSAVGNEPRISFVKSIDFPNTWSIRSGNNVSFERADWQDNSYIVVAVNSCMRFTLNDGEHDGVKYLILQYKVNGTVRMPYLLKINDVDIINKDLTADDVLSKFNNDFKYINECIRVPGRIATSITTNFSNLGVSGNETLVIPLENVKTFKIIGIEGPYATFVALVDSFNFPFFELSEGFDSVVELLTTGIEYTYAIGNAKYALVSIYAGGKYRYPKSIKLDGKEIVDYNIRDDIDSKVSAAKFDSIVGEGVIKNILLTPTGQKMVDGESIGASISTFITKGETVAYDLIYRSTAPQIVFQVTRDFVSGFYDINDSTYPYTIEVIKSEAGPTRRYQGTYTALQNCWVKAKGFVPNESFSNNSTLVVNKTLSDFVVPEVDSRGKLKEFNISSPKILLSNKAVDNFAIPNPIDSLLNYSSVVTVKEGLYYMYIESIYRKIIENDSASVHFAWSTDGEIWHRGYPNKEIVTSVWNFNESEGGFAAGEVNFESGTYHDIGTMVVEASDGTQSIIDVDASANGAKLYSNGNSASKPNIAQFYKDTVLRVRVNSVNDEIRLEGGTFIRINDIPYNYTTRRYTVTAEDVERGYVEITTDHSTYLTYIKIVTSKRLNELNVNVEPVDDLHPNLNLMFKVGKQYRYNVYITNEDTDNQTTDYCIEVLEQKERTREFVEACAAKVNDPVNPFRLIGNKAVDYIIVRIKNSVVDPSAGVETMNTVIDNIISSIDNGDTFVDGVQISRSLTLDILRYYTFKEGASEPDVYEGDYYIVTRKGTEPTVTHWKKMFMFKSADGIHWGDYDIDGKEISSLPYDSQYSVIPCGNMMKIYGRGWDYSRDSTYQRNISVMFTDLDGNIVSPFTTLFGDGMYNSAAFKIDDNRELLVPTFFDISNPANDKCEYLSYIVDGENIIHSSDVNEILRCIYDSDTTEEKEAKLREWGTVNPGFILKDGDIYFTYVHQRNESHESIIDSSKPTASQIKIVKLSWIRKGNYNTSLIRPNEIVQ